MREDAVCMANPSLTSNVQPRQVNGIPDPEVSLHVWDVPTTHSQEHHCQIGPTLKLAEEPLPG